MLMAVTKLQASLDWNPISFQATVSCAKPIGVGIARGDTFIYASPPETR
jgi:hypothetical protein